MEKEKSSFRGFEKILNEEHKQESRHCRGCENDCNYMIVTVESGQKFYAGDLCERYSGMQKKKLGENLPDLFEEREKMLFAYGKNNQDGKVIGIPRGLMFNEYFPFFDAFFSELGLNVVTSEKTNKRIIQKGLEKVLGEPCYPIKVAYGHVADILNKNINFLFLPTIINMPDGKNYPQSYTCPYIQAAPDMLKTAIEVPQNIKIISPTLYFRRGKKHLLHELEKSTQQLDISNTVVKNALDVALNAQQDFHNKQRKRGEEILNNLKDNDTAFVILGRPYSIYDPAISMNINKKIQDLGILAIPLDFLDLRHIDVSDEFSNLYSKQAQKILEAARIIKNDNRLRAVVLDYFACGPNAFINQFVNEELNQPFLILQIDEHTADAGVQTRLEAFVDTSMYKGKKTDKKIDTKQTSFSEIKEKGKKLWVPYMSEAAYILASVFRAYGVNAEVLPRSPDSAFNLARSKISGDVCLPMIVTSEDFFYHFKNFNSEKEAFFQGKSCGPCRYGNYFMLQKILSSEYEADFMTFGDRNVHDFNTAMLLNAWDGLMAHDILEKMLHHTRAYEKKAGESDIIFKKYVKEVCNCIEEKGEFSRKDLFNIIKGKHLKEFEKIIYNAQHEFSRIEKTDEQKPLIRIVGEFYIRLHDRANQNIARKIEDLGGEVSLATATEFFGYSNWINVFLSNMRWKEEHKKNDLKEFLKRKSMDMLATRDEHKLFHTALPYLYGLEEIHPKKLIELGSRYLNPCFGGEAICSIGSAEDYATREKKADGIVSVGPFNCMPSMIVRALSQEFVKRHNIPFLSVDYDGFEDNIRDMAIDSFMRQVKERFEK